MEEEGRLHDREYEFACVVWENEPIASGELAKLCAQRLGWKRTTTYTVLKKLCERGILCNDHAMVSALVKKEMVQRTESRYFVEKMFDDSILHLVASFAEERPLRRDRRAESVDRRICHPYRNWAFVCWQRMKRRLREAHRVTPGIYETDMAAAPFAFGLFCPAICRQN